MCWSKIFVWILKQKPSILVGSRHTWSFCARFLRKSWQRIFFFVTRSSRYACLPSKTLSYSNFWFYAFMCKVFRFLMRKNVYATESSSFFVLSKRCILHAYHLPRSIHFLAPEKQNNAHINSSICVPFSLFFVWVPWTFDFCIIFYPSSQLQFSKLSHTHFFSPSLRCFFSFSLCLAIKMAKNQRVKRNRNKMWSKNTCSLTQSILWDEKKLLSAFMRSSRHQKNIVDDMKTSFLFLLMISFFSWSYDFQF